MSCAAQYGLLNTGEPAHEKQRSLVLTALYHFLPIGFYSFQHLQANLPIPQPLHTNTLLRRQSPHLRLPPVRTSKPHSFPSIPDLSNALNLVLLFKFDTSDPTSHLPLLHSSSIIPVIYFLGSEPSVTRELPILKGPSTPY